MFKNNLYSLIKSTKKLLVGILGLSAALLVSFYAKPSISDIVIYKSSPDNFLLMKQGEYYVPYVKHSENKFVRGYDRCIDIRNGGDIKVVENGTKLLAEGNKWFISVPSENNVLVLTPENRKAIKSNLESGNLGGGFFSSSIRCIDGDVNGIWFKEMRVFMPIHNKIDMVSSRINEKNILDIGFMSDREKYFCISVSGNELDISGASIESLDVLKKYGIMRERTRLYNVYKVLMAYVDKAMSSYGLLNGSLIIMFIMLLIMSYEIYMKILRVEMNQNKKIELEIAKKEFAYDSAKLEKAIVDINNSYAEKDKSFLWYSILFIIFENYMQFGILSDYSGFLRGFMLGNNDLGIAEIVNLSNLFGLFSSNVLHSIGPLVLIVAAILVSGERVMIPIVPIDDSSEVQSDEGFFTFRRILSFLIVTYMFVAKSVFFLLFYIVYTSIKNFFIDFLVKLRSKSDVRFVG